MEVSSRLCPPKNNVGVANLTHNDTTRFDNKLTRKGLRKMTPRPRTATADSTVEVGSYLAATVNTLTPTNEQGSAVDTQHNPTAALALSRATHPSGTFVLFIAKVCQGERVSEEDQAASSLGVHFEPDFIRVQVCRVEEEVGDESEGMRGSEGRPSPRSSSTNKTT